MVVQKDNQITQLCGCPRTAQLECEEIYLFYITVWRSEIRTFLKSDTQMLIYFLFQVILKF
jgi:hypothetical protein